MKFFRFLFPGVFRDYRDRGGGGGEEGALLIIPPNHFGSVVEIVNHAPRAATSFNFLGGDCRIGEK